jgi:hypothetical protein
MPRVNPRVDQPVSVPHTSADYRKRDRSVPAPFVIAESVLPSGAVWSFLSAHRSSRFALVGVRHVGVLAASAEGGSLGGRAGDGTGHEVHAGRT